MSNRQGGATVVGWYYYGCWVPHVVVLDHGGDADWTTIAW